MKNTQNIIFDLGHVIIDLDFQRTIDQFHALGFNDFLFTPDHVPKIFGDLEVGKVSSDDFISFWQQKKPSVSREEIILAWNALLLGIQPSVMKLLEQLTSTYRLFIYSNTNEIHIQWVMKYLQDTFHINDFVPHLFTAAHYSHELGFRKPDAAGFEKILSQHGIAANETVFIDDHLPNILAALKLGIRGIHKKPSDELGDILMKNSIY